MADKNAVAEPDETVKGSINPAVNSVEDGGGNVLSTHKLREVPSSVKKSYLEVDGKYFFMERPDHLAFEDRGNRIRTDLNNAKVAGSMLDIAQAKGWTGIKVKGKETFRREAWLQATARGMEVKGYSPREEDLARLKKLVRDREEGKPDPQAKEQENEPVNCLAGKLIEHGKAPYKHDKENSESYFVTLENSDGKERTTWGVDLERAVTESGANRGDQIELENHGRKPVVIDRAVKDDKGNVIRTEKVSTHRNQWEVNAEALRNEKENLAELVKEHPDLLCEAAVIKVGEKFSQRNFYNNADRQRFNDRVRERVATDYNMKREAPPIYIKEERTINRQKEVEIETDR